MTTAGKRVYGAERWPRGGGWNLRVAIAIENDDGELMSQYDALGYVEDYEPATREEPASGGSVHFDDAEEQDDKGNWRRRVLTKDEEREATEKLWELASGEGLTRD